MMFKEIKNKFFNFFVEKLTRRQSYLNKLKIEKVKITLLESLQSYGSGSKLNGKNWTFRSSQNMIIGRNVHIGDNAYFVCDGGLLIGDNTHISRNVTIYTANHNFENNALPYDRSMVYKPVKIDKNVWIGMNVSIIPGITIGEGAVIGMGTVVSRDIEPLEVVGNAQIRSLKYRDSKRYKLLNQNECYGGVNGKILEKKIEENSYHSNRMKPIIFILGTGRSGSKAITDTLNQSSKIKAFHEDIHQLIRISTLIAENPENQEEYLHEIKEIFQLKNWQASENQVLVHSDQRMWNLIPFLSNFFPNSKFIHLKREPIKCVKSMVARDWYKKDEYPVYNTHDWAKYRLNAHKIGSLTAEEWGSYDHVDKCSWYWSYLTSHIENELKDLPQDKVLSLDLENLDQRIDDVLAFIGVNDKIHNIMRTNKLNAARYSNYIKDDAVHERINTIVERHYN